MKKKQYLTTLATGLALATPTHAALTANLVAYYDFESDLSNQAPGASGTDATWVGTQTFSEAGFTGNAAFDPGDGLSDRSTLLVGNALNIADIDNTHINVPFSSATLGSTFTISAWTYLAPGASNGSNRFQALESSDSGVYDVSWGTTGNYSTTGRNDYIGYVETASVPASNQFAEEEWDHVLMTYDTSGANPTVSIYINGAAVPLTGTDTSGTFSFSSLHFGDARTGASGDRDWDGMIDEVAIWDRALTADERTQVYNNGLNGIAIPEPSSSLLLGLGGLALALRRRK